jgi:hypothetical protein
MRAIARRKVQPTITVRAGRYKVIVLRLHEEYKMCGSWAAAIRPDCLAQAQVQPLFRGSKQIVLAQVKPVTLPPSSLKLSMKLNFFNSPP